MSMIYIDLFRKLRTCQIFCFYLYLYFQSCEPTAPRTTTAVEHDPTKVDNYLSASKSALGTS